MVIINSIYNDVSKQGLGNRLFQYCWSREIAERKGYALEGKDDVDLRVYDEKRYKFIYE